MNSSEVLLGDFLEPTAVTSQLMSGALKATPLSIILAFVLAFMTIFSAYNVGSFAMRWVLILHQWSKTA